MAGFGISTPSDVAGLDGLVDGVIVGSAFLRALGSVDESALNVEEVVNRANEFLKPFNPVVK